MVDGAPTTPQQQARKRWWLLFRGYVEQRGLTDVTKAMVMFVGSLTQYKWSSRKNILIHLLSAARRKGFALASSPVIKDYIKEIELALLREVPKKAELLSDDQMNRLLRCGDYRLAVPLALMLPAGMRFADAEKIRRADVASLKGSQLTFKVMQAKNIRMRQHQTWYSMTIPHALLPYLELRLKEASPTCHLLTITYSEFMYLLRAYLGDPRITTYSIRRTVFDRLRGLVNTIGELQQVTLHRNAAQLRMYLEGPLPDELTNRVRLTSWHEKV